MKKARIVSSSTEHPFKIGEIVNVVKVKAMNVLYCKGKDGSEGYIIKEEYEKVE
jgi:hypothetical protein